MMDLPKGQEWVFEMVNNILIEVLGTIAEQERQTIRMRQLEGLEAARKANKHLGRKATEKPENWKDVFSLWDNKKITARQAMKMLGVSKNVFYKWVKDFSA